MESVTNHSSLIARPLHFPQYHIQISPPDSRWHRLSLLQDKDYFLSYYTSKREMYLNKKIKVIS